MPGCLIYTCAYNAAKTIKRTAKSILNQTEKNWVWYLLDNGSTDSTGSIIKQLAEKDSRIKPLKNTKNHVWEKGNSAIEVIRNNSSFDYFCWIDSDDDVDRTYIESLIDYSKKNDCDVVCCTYNSIDARNGSVIETKAPCIKNIINTKSLFDKGFIYYYSNCRTYWGKIFRMSSLLKTNTDKFPKLYYGWDTLFCLEVLINSKSLGFIQKPLYRYYISKKSGSHTYDSTRIDSDRILFEFARSYLNRKCGAVSGVNLIFLLIVYLNAVNDTYNVLINSDLQIPEKIKELHRMVVCEYTNLFISNSSDSDVFLIDKVETIKNELFTKIASWLLTCTEVPDELVEDFVETGEIACTIVKSTDGWLYFEKIRINFLIMQKRLDEAREKLEAASSLFPNDNDIILLKNQIL